MRKIFLSFMGIILIFFFVANDVYSESKVEFNDAIALFNGDILIGKFIGDDGKDIKVIRGDDVISVSRQDIVSIKTETDVVCHFVDGEIIRGKIDYDEAMMLQNNEKQHYIISGIFGPVPFSWGKIKSIELMDVDAGYILKNKNVTQDIGSSESEVRKNELNLKNYFEINETKEETGNYLVVSPSYTIDGVGDGYVSNISDSVGLSISGGIDILDNVEFNFGLPLFITQKKNASIFEEKSSKTDFSLQNLNLGFSVNVLKQRPLLPNVSLSINTAIPFNTSKLEEIEPYSDYGFYSIGFGSDFSYSIENVKYFVSIGYLKPISKIIDEVRVLPGVRVDGTFGLAYAISENILLSTRLVLIRVYPTKFDDQDFQMIEDTQISLRQDVFMQLQKNTIIRPYAQIGISDNSPDLKVGIDYILGL